MLVLSRRVGESLIFGSPVLKIMVLEIDHGQVKIGITAPDTLRIYREEVYEKIQAKEKD